MSTIPDSPIYLDHHATTPVDEQVVEAMNPHFTEVYANPASNNEHRMGDEAASVVSDARETVASSFGARTEEIIFTSGATESDNLALRGVAEYARKHDRGNHVITAATEHDAIVEQCEQLEQDGFEITVLPVDEHGLVDPADVREAIRPDTILVSIMAANNEIGTLAPLAEIGALTSDEDVPFHTDAVQAVGYRDLDVNDFNIDLMSISGHKIYGPKGVGALYVRRRRPKVQLQPLLYGGGHERGWRSGTLNVPGIVGLSKAVELAVDEQSSRTDHVERLRDRLWEGLTDELDDLVLNGHPDRRLPNNLNVSFLGVDNRRLVTKLGRDIAVSAGSACSTTETQDSHVLRAITDDDDRIQSAMRFGLGKDNTEADIDYAIDTVVNAVSRLRRIGSLG
jgi:cysteine desulfurase